MAIIGKGRGRQVADGLTILLKYQPDGNASALHDEIQMVGPAPDDLDPVDRSELEEAAWYWNEAGYWYYFT